MITVSIVSHRHGEMVSRLVSQLLFFPEVEKIVVTLNISEQLSFSESGKILTVENSQPRGFGANHNTAFRKCQSEYFCVLNPDVIFLDNPFPSLLISLNSNKAAVAAPLVVSSDGKIEDSVRRFPTIATLFAKSIGLDDGRYLTEFGQENMEPDWIAGMFMLFRSRDFRSINGFDEAFFLYYEDVDICARLWKNNRIVVLCPSAKIIHDAQRSSHSDWRFRRWHMQSLVRYLFRYAGRYPRRRVIPR